MPKKNDYTIQLGADAKNLKNDVRKAVKDALSETDEISKQLKKGMSFNDIDTSELEKRLGVLEEKVDKLTNSGLKAKEVFGSMKNFAKDWAKLNQFMETAQRQSVTFYQTLQNITQKSRQFGADVQDIYGTQPNTDFSQIEVGLDKVGGQVKVVTQELKDAQAALDEFNKKMNTAYSGGANFSNNKKDLEQLITLLEKADDAYLNYQDMLKQKQDGQLIDSAEFDKVEKEYVELGHKVQSILKQIKSDTNMTEFVRGQFFDIDPDTALEDLTKDLDKLKNEIRQKLSQQLTNLGAEQQVKIKPVKISVDIKRDYPELIGKINKYITDVQARAKFEPIKIPIQVYEYVDTAQDKTAVKDDNRFEKTITNFNKKYEQLSETLTTAQSSLLDKTTKWQQEMNKAMKLRFTFQKLGREEGETLLDTSEFIQGYFDEHPVDLVLNEEGLRDNIQNVLNDGYTLNIENISNALTQDKINIEPNTEKLIADIQSALNNAKFVLNFGGGIALNGNVTTNGNLNINTGGEKQQPVVPPTTPPSQGRPSSVPPSTNQPSVGQKENTAATEGNSKAVERNTQAQENTKDAVQECVNAIKEWIVKTQKNALLDKPAYKGDTHWRSRRDNSIERLKSFDSIFGKDIRQMDFNSNEFKEAIIKYIINKSDVVSMLTDSDHRVKLTSGVGNLFSNKVLNSITAAQSSKGVNSQTVLETDYEIYNEQYLGFLKSLVQMGSAIKAANSNIDTGFIPSLKALESVISSFSGEYGLGDYNGIITAAKAYAAEYKDLDEIYAENGGIVARTRQLRAEKKVQQSILDNPSSTSAEKEKAQRLYDAAEAELSDIYSNLSEYAHTFEAAIKGIGSDIVNALNGFSGVFTIKRPNGKTETLAFNNSDPNTKANKRYTSRYTSANRLIGNLNNNEVVSTQFSSVPNDSLVNVWYEGTMKQSEAIQKVINAYNALTPAQQEYINQMQDMNGNYFDINKLMDENISASEKFQHIEDTLFSRMMNKGKEELTINPSISNHPTKISEDFVNTLSDIMMNAFSSKRMKNGMQRMLGRDSSKNAGTYTEATGAVPLAQQSYSHTKSDSIYRTQKEIETPNIDELKARQKQYEDQLAAETKKREEITAQLAEVQQAQQKNTQARSAEVEARKAKQAEYPNINSDNFEEYEEQTASDLQQLQVDVDSLTKAKENATKAIQTCQDGITESDSIIKANQTILDKISASGGLATYLNNLDKTIKQSTEEYENSFEQENKEKLALNSKMLLLMTDGTKTSEEINAFAQQELRAINEKYITRREELRAQKISAEQERKSLSLPAKSDGMSIRQYGENYKKQLRTNIQNAQDRKNSLQEQLTQNTNEEQQLSSQLEQKEQEISSKTEELSNVRYAFTEDYANYLKTTIAKEQEELKAQDKSLSGLNTERGKKYSQLTGQQHKMKSAGAYIESYQNTPEQGRTSEITEKFNENVKIYEEAKQQAEKLQAEITELDEIIQSTNNTRARLQKSLTDHTTEQNRIADMLHPFDDTRKIVNNLETEASNVENEIGQLTTRKEQIDQQIADLEAGKTPEPQPAPVESMEPEQIITAARQEIENILADYDRVDARINEAQKEKATIQKRLANLKNNIDNPNNSYILKGMKTAANKRAMDDAKNTDEYGRYVAQERANKNQTVAERNAKLYDKQKEIAERLKKNNPSKYEVPDIQDLIEHFEHLIEEQDKVIAKEKEWRKQLEADEKAASRLYSQAEEVIEKRNQASSPTDKNSSHTTTSDSSKVAQDTAREAQMEADANSQQIQENKQRIAKIEATLNQDRNPTKKEFWDLLSEEQQQGFIRSATNKKMSVSDYLENWSQKPSTSSGQYESLQAWLQAELDRLYAENEKLGAAAGATGRAAEDTSSLSNSIAETAETMSEENRNRIQEIDHKIDLINNVLNSDNPTAAQAWNAIDPEEREFFINNANQKGLKVNDVFKQFLKDNDIKDLLDGRIEELAEERNQIINSSKKASTSGSGTNGELYITNGDGPWALESTLGKTNELLNLIASKMDSAKQNSNNNNSIHSGTAAKTVISSNPQQIVTGVPQALLNASSKIDTTGYTLAAQTLDDQAQRLVQTYVNVKGEILQITTALKQVEETGEQVAVSTQKHMTNFTSIAKKAYAEIGNLTTIKDFAGQDAPQELLDKYSDAVKQLDDAMNGLKDNSIIDVDEANRIKLATDNVALLRKEILNTVKAAGEQAKKDIPTVDITDVKNRLFAEAGANNKNNFAGYTLSAETFDEKTLKLTQTLIDANGQALKLTYTFDTLNGTINSTVKETTNFTGVAKKAYSEIGSNFNALNQSIQGLNIPQDKLQAYQDAVQHLKDELANLGEKGITNPDDANRIQAATENAKKLRQEILGVVQASQSLADNNEIVKAFGDEKVDSARQALIDYATSIKGAKIEQDSLKGNVNELQYVIENEEGALQTVTLRFDQTTNAIYKMGVATKSATKLFSGFFVGLKSKIVQLMQYYSGAMLLQKAFQEIRQGVQYVREIDLALTELKKVTDETDSSYRQFVKNMGDAASVIGSTTKDLVNSAADWARLNN